MGQGLAALSMSGRSNQRQRPYPTTIRHETKNCGITAIPSGALNNIAGRFKPAATLQDRRRACIDDWLIGASNASASVRCVTGTCKRIRGVTNPDIETSICK